LDLVGFHFLFLVLGLWFSMVKLVANNKTDRNKRRNTVADSAHTWMRRVFAYSLLAGFALAAASCDTSTHFHEAQVSGVPTCPTGELLRRSVCLELDDGDDYHLRQMFSGTGRRVTMSLPEERRAWRFRAGQCQNAREPGSSSYNCGECQIYWELGITTDADTARLAVPPPAGFECTALKSSGESP
jgi:hypothetical protein